MNLIKQPQLWTPGYNPVLYQFGSTFSSVLYFEVNIRDTAQNAIILTEKAYVTPVSPTSSDYNWQDVARDVVSWEINTDVAILAPITKSVRNIDLLVRESGLVNNRIEYLTSTFSTSAINVWNAKITRDEFTDYYYSNLVFGLTSGEIKFLTTKPNSYVVNDSSREYLYFLKSPALDATWKIETLTPTYSVISSTSGSLTSTASMMRLDISPKTINGLLNGFLTASNAYAYSVQLFNGSATASEKKIYDYEPGYPCGIDIVNILWENNLGGIDSYQFVNPIETREVERITQEKNIYRYFNADYTDIQKNVYNQREKIIDTNLNANYRMWTKPLTDSENNWIAGLLHSKNVFIELSNRRIYPVNLVETSYTIERGKFNPTAPIQSEWTFKVNKDYITSETILGDKQPVLPPPPSTTTTTTSTTTTTTTSNLPTTTTTTTTTSTTTTTTTIGGLTYSFYIYGSNNPSDSCEGLNGSAFLVYSPTWTELVSGEFYYDASGNPFPYWNIYSYWSANIYANGCLYGYFSSSGQWNQSGRCQFCY